MTQYLLDTNILIELERSAPPALLPKISAHQGSLWVSSVSVMELFYGAEKSTQPELSAQATRDMLSLLNVADFSSADAEDAGRLRGDLSKTGTPIGAYDTLIAGQARSRGMVLVTNNTREFTRVPGLRFENWLES